jgi:hypothetical protein
VFWVISVYFNIRNTLSKFFTFLPGHPVYCKRNIAALTSTHSRNDYTVSIIYSESVFVALGIMHANAHEPYFHLCPVWFYHIFPHYKYHDFWQEKSIIKRVLISFPNFSGIFLIVIPIEQDI